MIDRTLVQQFYDGIREASYKSQEVGNKKVFALLDAHPRLALIRFKDYLGDDPDTLGYPLDQPILSANLELAERLIALGADVNAFWGEPQLNVAVEMSFAKKLLPWRSEIGTDMIELLLKSGADPNVPDHHGRAALHIAMNKKEAARIVPLLLGYGANPNQRDLKGSVPLQGYSRGIALEEVENYRSILHAMVAHGVDVNTADDAGETLLMNSIRRHCYAVTELLGYGANVRAQRRDGWTALHEAVGSFLYKRDAETITLLLQAGADIHAKDNRGYTPLHVAAACGAVKAARLLVEAGADVHAQSDQGETALNLVQARKQPFDLDRSTSKERKKMTEFLLEQGAVVTPGIVPEKQRPRTIWDV
jgi:ankyrin repeat protein